MAAILCTTVSDLVGASCRAAGQVICLPFKACDRVVCDTINNMICTPFMPYLVVTFALNTPALVYAIRALDNRACPELFTWLLVNAILSAIHMIAAFYIINQIRSEPSSSITTASTTIAAITGLSPVISTSSKMEEGKAVPAAADAIATPYGYLNDNSSSNNNNSSNNSNVHTATEAYSFGRISHVLCYDHGMALYIVVIILWAVWLFVGITRRFDFNDDNYVCDELVGYMNVTIICGYLWAMLVACAFCCSLICLRR